ncbi:DUF5343 domain-containing protein [Rhizobium sp. S-51]|uniref:DUF5343 domain-containing protein n=1 Tax=Rhizobium terricola TaxID=2728849 RepID=A0A7Y0FWC8_9HYPH|nr:DUF5343 domain-containing protein [Rhizobium terricola]NML74534.1 DUF5343 domain-containing protein [Rhizobium terricola]
MAKDGDSSNKIADADADTASANSEKTERREIKGGIPYTASPGVFKKALETIITAERPDKFNPNFMETILGIRGGAARAVPPLFKKMQFIGADGTPTPLYSKFKTEGGRSQAAFEALKSAFGELFKRNEYIYRADEGAVKDVLVEITGLKRNDPIIRQMQATFDSIRSFIDSEPSKVNDERHDENSTSLNQSAAEHAGAKLKLGLSYQINIVLPETENIAVFNAIFKSLRENLLR